MKWFPFLLSIGCLVGCTHTHRPTAATEAPVLEQLTTNTRYTTSERCLSFAEYDRVEVLDDRHLLFSNTGGTEIWINKLNSRCPSLARNATLSFDVRGNRICSLDTARVLERFVFGNLVGPTCSLGEFEPLTTAQAGVVRRAR